MRIVRLRTPIAAPPTRCFDLAREVELHTRSLASSGERAVAGVTRGLLVLGDSVTWEGRHPGVRQRLTARITNYERPHFFVDEQVVGAFDWFRHTHLFVPDGAGTIMIDRFVFAVPLGPLGLLAERLFLARYMRRLLYERALVLKAAAERGEWAEAYHDNVDEYPAIR
jgi:hypothetical protein